MFNARFFIAVVSMVSMVLQPVAYGQQQANWASQALKDFVKANQRLGKSVTVKEFWEKNKRKFHPDWQKKFYPAVELQKDERLPQMDIITVKGPNGTETARLMLTLPSQKTITLEYMGGDSKFVRFNNQIISYEDFFNGEGFLDKVTEDSVVKGEADRVRNMALNASVIPSYQLFARMTAQQRVDYFVNLRSLLQAATEVTNRAVEASQKKEGASFIQLLLEKAYAGNVPKDWINQRCIVAGYVGIYKKDNTGYIYCDHKEALKNFNALANLENLSGSNTAKASCSDGSLRCNPFVYGFEREGGQSLCVPIGKTEAYQKASRTCDSASPLRAHSLVADTEAMIKTLLNKEGKNSSEYFKDGKVISEEKYNELMNGVVKNFNTFIDQAIGTCKESNNLDGTTNFGEKNQGDACYVLRQRKLAFEVGFKGLQGLYEKPTPTPAPPVTQPPIAKEGECDIPGTNPPKRGYYDYKCQCLEPGAGEAGPTAKPEVKDGKCTPAAVVPPPPVKTADDCANRPQMDKAFDRNGKIGCVARDAKMETDNGAGKCPKGGKGRKCKDDDGFSCSVICPLGLAALMMWGAYAATKPHHVNTPGQYTPPVPPPLTPTPTPTPVTPVPPIIPTLPIPNPALGEGGTTPAPSIGTGGTR